MSSGRHHRAPATVWTAIFTLVVLNLALAAAVQRRPALCKAVAALRETLALCKREGILAAVVFTSENSDFRSWYGPAAAAVAEILQICRQDADGRVVDARAWMPDDAFADGHHMFDVAAPTYTSRLVRELILPAIRERRPR